MGVEVLEPKMRRAWAMPNHNTFDVKPIGEFVRWYLNNSKLSIDPFARNKRWATITNDLSPDTQAEFHMEALDFLKMLRGKKVKADLVIFDPPYSLRQCTEVYKSVGRDVTMRDTQIFGRWTEHKEVICDVLADDGIALSFGWNSQGMGLKNEFNIEEILLVCHGGAHNDTICLAERRLL